MVNKVENAIVGTLAGLMSLGSVANAAELRVGNYSPTINGNKVRLVQGTGSSGYATVPAPSFENYRLTDAGVKQSLSPVNISLNNTFNIPLVYNGTIVNGTSNFIRFDYWKTATTPSSTNNFATNIIQTARIEDWKGYTNVINIDKAVKDSGIEYFDNYIKNVQNAVSGQQYGQVIVRIAPYDGKFTNAQNHSINLTNWDVSGFTYTIAQQPTNGNASFNGSVLNYSANGNGTDNLVYQLNFGTNNCGQRSATFVSTNAVPLNTAPIAYPTNYSVFKGQGLEGKLEGFDTEQGTNGLTFGLLSVPTNGGFNVDTNTGAFSYMPGNNFVGTDGLTFNVRDTNNAVSGQANVGITVLDTNYPPVAMPLSLTNGSKTTCLLPFNGSDYERSNLVYEIVDFPMNGSISVAQPGQGNTNGPAFFYSPSLRFSDSTDSFTYRAFDGEKYSELANVSIQNTNQNGIPVGLSTNYVSKTGKAFGGYIFSTDEDALDNNVFEIVNAPTNGTAGLRSSKGLNTSRNSPFTYTPAPNFVGRDSFSFRAFDGKDYSEPANVDIQVVGYDIPKSNAVSKPFINGTNVNMGYSGIPGYDAVLHRTRGLGEGFTAIKTNSIGENGFTEFVVPRGDGFYKVEIRDPKKN